MSREYQYREDIPLLEEMATGGHQDAPNKRIPTLSSAEPLFGNAREQHDHDGDFVTTNEREDLARGLHQRHIGLIALAGAIVCFECSHSIAHC
jgi:amino acid permease